MGLIDWLVLGGTMLLIVGYGSWKTRKNKNLESYLKGNNEEKWFTIGLSIMATQAVLLLFCQLLVKGMNQEWDLYNFTLVCH